MNGGNEEEAGWVRGWREYLYPFSMVPTGSTFEDPKTERFDGRSVLMRW